MFDYLSWKYEIRSELFLEKVYLKKRSRMMMWYKYSEFERVVVIFAVIEILF